MPIKINIGTKSTCHCGKPIVFTGRYWEHEGASYRHPASPSTDAPKQHANQPNGKTG